MKNSVIKGVRVADATIRLLEAAPRGAASWYATFGPVAVMYYPGMWLIAPVAAGTVISISDEALDILHKQYPNNRFIHALHSGAVFMNQGIGGFMNDFGFMWSMVTTSAVFIGGISYANNQFARIFAPMIGFLPAALARAVTYRMSQDEHVPKLIRHAGFFARGASSASCAVGAFQQQGLLAPDSYIPPSIFGVTALWALMASVLKERAPRLSMLMETMLVMFCENPSLVALAFNLPNDIYAAYNDDEVNDTFFYSTAGMATLFLTLLTITTVLRPALKDETRADDLNESDDDDVENRYLPL